VAAATTSPPHHHRGLRRRGADTHTIELFRTRRIDSYRAVIDGAEWQARIGWSRVLDGMRRALPRLLSPRNHASE
jgi:hypothetical protein